MGNNVKIGIFDTGISEIYFKENEENIKEIKNWTNEKLLNDETIDLNGIKIIICVFCKLN